MSFKENLRKYRELAGYPTAKEFASVLTNTSYDAYIGYENKGREPKYSILVEIAQKLKVTVDELLDNKQCQLDKYINICQKVGFKFYSDDEQKNKRLTQNEIAFTVSDTKIWQKAFHIDTGEPIFILSKEGFISLVEKVLFSDELSVTIFSSLYKEFNDASLKHVLLESTTLIMKELDYTEKSLHLSKPLKALSNAELISLNKKLSEQKFLAELSDYANDPSNPNVDVQAANMLNKILKNWKANKDQ